MAMTRRPARQNYRIRITTMRTKHRRVARVTNQMKNSVKVCVTNSKAYCCCTTLPNVLAAGAARSRHCADMKLLWKHMEACKDKHCKVTHCRSSRWIVKHYRKCVDVNCSVCGPVRTAVRNSKHADSTRPTMGSIDDTSFSGSTCSTQKQSNVSTPGSQSPLVIRFALQQAPQLPPPLHTAQEHLPSQSPHIALAVLRWTREWNLIWLFVKPHFTRTRAINRRQNLCKHATAKH
jgi:TAZ zinc finger